MRIRSNLNVVYGRAGLQAFSFLEGHLCNLSQFIASLVSSSAFLDPLHRIGSNVARYVQSGANSTTL